MALLELLIVETIASGATTAGLKKMQERSDRKAALMDWRIDTRLPVLDSVLAKWRGTPSGKVEAYQSKIFISLARSVVNLRAFQYFVEGCFNANSTLRRKLPFLQKLTARSRS